jgi:hypothetical protein
MKTHTPEELAMLTRFMNENDLSQESKLFRYTSKDYLNEIDGKYYIEAKTEPLDMVIDNYQGSSHVFISSDIGQGLSFLTAKEDEYQSSDRICVELNLKDVLDQGGLIYEVTSLPAYLKAFFCTLPEGNVKVTVVS